MAGDCSVSLRVWFFSLNILAQESTNQPSLNIEARSETEAKANKVKAKVLIDQARGDFGNARIDAATEKFDAAQKLDPQNREISYYLTLIRARRAGIQNAVGGESKIVLPVIRRSDGQIKYGIPAEKKRLRELADDLSGR
jgi:hypothetical protein